MLLTTTTISESNREFLRILLTAFYTSSEKARELHKLVEKYTSGSSDRKDFHLCQAWSRVSQEFDVGPLPKDRHERLVATADQAAESHFKMMTKDTKARFFAHLIEFVRDLHLYQIQGNVRPTNVLNRKFTFVALAASEEFNALRKAVRGHLPELVKDLQNDGVRDLILSDFTPAKVAFNVVPIRPDIVVIDPNAPVIQPQQVAQSQEDPTPPSPPAAQLG